MGWSHSRAAGQTLEKIERACRESTGSNNAWTEGDRKKFFELDCEEHDSGAITGEIFVMVDDVRARRLMGFTIFGDGSLGIRAPRFFLEHGGAS